MMNNRSLLVRINLEINTALAERVFDSNKIGNVLDIKIAYLKEEPAKFFTCKPKESSAAKHRARFSHEPQQKRALFLYICMSIKNVYVKEINNSREANSEV